MTLIWLFNQFTNTMWKDEKMQRPRDYDTAEVKKQGGEFPQPEAGGYILKVIKAEEKFSKKNNSMLVLYFDIVNGEFENHYKKISEKIGKDIYLTYYQLIEGEHLSYFKGMIDTFELCNQNFKFNFDEQTLVGKRIGANLREEEYENKEGEIKSSLKIGHFATIAEVNAGLVPMRRKLLKDESKRNQSYTLENVQTSVSKDLPF